MKALLIVCLLAVVAHSVEPEPPLNDQDIRAALQNLGGYHKTFGHVNTVLGAAGVISALLYQGTENSRPGVMLTILLPSIGVITVGRWQVSIGNSLSNL